MSKEKLKDITKHLLKAGEVGVYKGCRFQAVKRAVKRADYTCFSCYFEDSYCEDIKCGNTRFSRYIMLKKLD